MLSRSIEQGACGKPHLPLLAAVEVTPSEDGDYRDLLFAAYRASQRGMIALLLCGIKPAEVDAILDAVVCELPRNIPGVIYVDASDVLLTSHVVERAARVYIRSDHLRACSGNRQSCGLPSTAAMIALATADVLTKAAVLMPISDESRQTANHPMRHLAN